MRHLVVSSFCGIFTILAHDRQKFRFKRSNTYNVKYRLLSGSNVYIHYNFSLDYKLDTLVYFNTIARILKQKVTHECGEIRSIFMFPTRCDTYPFVCLSYLLMIYYRRVKCLSLNVKL